MKKVLLFASCAAMLSFAACENKEKVEETKNEVSTDLINNPATASEEAVQNNEDLPEFEFAETVIEFGDISQGEKVKRTFSFTNVGKSNLIISNAKGSCGCTVPVWPKEPIAPGATGEIEVVFDSNGKSGKQHKTVTLVANTVPNTMVLAIKGNVLVPEQTQAQ